VGSGRRITVGLVALVLLAVVGWVVTDVTGHGTRHDHPGHPAGVTAPLSPSAPKPAAASG
jgi:hypothetical protein